MKSEGESIIIIIIMYSSQSRLDASEASNKKEEREMCRRKINVLDYCDHKII